MTGGGWNRGAHTCFAPVVDVGDRGLPRAEQGAGWLDIDAGLAGAAPVAEGGTRVGVVGHGTVDAEPGGLAQLVQEGGLHDLLPGGEDKFEPGAVVDIGADGPGVVVDGLHSRHTGRDGDAVEVDGRIVVGGVTVSEDAEDEAVPPLDMDCAVQEGLSRECVSARDGAGDAFEEDRQRECWRRLSLRWRPWRFGCGEGYGCAVGVGSGFRGVDGCGFLAEELRRRQGCLPGGNAGGGENGAGGNRAAAPREAGEAEPGGVLAFDEVGAPAVLAKAEQDGGIGDAGAVVRYGDGETRLPVLGRPGEAVREVSMVCKAGGAAARRLECPLRCASRGRRPMYAVAARR